MKIKAVFPKRRAKKQKRQLLGTTFEASAIGHRICIIISLSSDKFFSSTLDDDTLDKSTKKLEPQHTAKTTRALTIKRVVLLHTQLLHLEFSVSGSFPQTNSDLRVGH